MPRPSKPTFITELPLVASLGQDAVMLGRFEAGRRLYNAVLGDALKALDLMRQSKAWAAARALPKGKDRTAAFKACNQRFGFTEYALHSVATGHKNAAGFCDRLGAHETQKIASRVFACVQAYAFGQRGRPRFKGKNRPLHSLEGKTNVAGIRWDGDTATVTWGKGFVLPVLVPKNLQDPYLHACLLHPTKYCRIVWRMQQGKRRWFVQLVQDGMAPAKYDYLASGQTIGLDIGPSTVAIVGDTAVGLQPLAPSVEQPWKAMRKLQRAQDRGRRATNPDNYAPNGTVKAGVRRWAKSNRYRARQSRLQELERCLAAARKRDHGQLANQILGLGHCIQIEQLSYKSLQKNFGRSAKVRASGMFVQLLTRKAESAGGQVVELNTRTLTMSQYDHTTGVCTKKPLSQRWHRLGSTSTLVQRDCYSAFLAKNVMENQHKPTRLEQSWATTEPLLRRAGLCTEQSASARASVFPTVAIPSERIARQRRFVRGHARDVVAARPEPGNPSQSAFRTPGLYTWGGSEGALDMRTDTAITVYVIVKLDGRSQPSDPEDEGLEGVYEVNLSAETPKEGIANAALDGFHNAFGVGVLDDFTFTVHQVPDVGSPAIEQSEAFESYALSGHCEGVERTGDIPAPAASSSANPWKSTHKD